LVKYLRTPQEKNFHDNNISGMSPPAEGTLSFSYRQYYFPEKTEVFPAKKLGQFSAQRAPLGLVPAKKLGQFSAQREAFSFGRSANLFINKYLNFTVYHNYCNKIFYCKGLIAIFKMRLFYYVKVVIAKYIADGTCNTIFYCKGLPFIARYIPILPWFTHRRRKQFNRSIFHPHSVPKGKAPSYFNYD
jgi:hypothetical protein